MFERINRAGTELNVFELLSAWSWSEEFDLVERFAHLQDEISEHGFEDLCNNKDLQLRICAGVITGETTPNRLMDLTGQQIRESFANIERGILGALDFLKREANVTHYKLLPFPGLLVPLSAYFATDKADGQNYTARQKSGILRWFWRSLFNRRYSADVNQRQAIDIVELLKLRADENYALRLPPPENRIDFKMGNFNTGNANSCTFILMLNSLAPCSFLSGARIDTNKVLKKGSKHEYHHIFPRRFLELSGVPPERINVLANICFLTRSDNNTIKATSPAEYAKEIDAVHRVNYLSSALCPNNLGMLTYDDFLAARLDLLENHAMELMI